MTPVISIIIPVYNVENYLRKCLDSIIAQTFTQWECILIDDGSLDSSGSICDEYVAAETRFKVIHKKNEGVSSARNAGLNYANGEYICFIDSDDWVGEQYLSNLYNAIENNKVDFVISGHNRIDSDGSKDSFQYDDDIISRNRYDDIFLKHNLQKHGSPWSKLFKKELIGSLRFNPDIHLGEDIIFLYNYILNTRKISFLSCSDYNYVYRSGSLTMRLNSYESEWMGWQEFYKVSNELRKRMIGERAYIRNNNNTVFIERVINAIYHDTTDRATRIERLRLIDLDLYRKCKSFYTCKEYILFFLLVHRMFGVYDFLMMYIHKR